MKVQPANNNGFVRPSHVWDGMEVYIRLDGRLLKVVITAAMGHTARVSNPLHGVDTWWRVDELLIAKT